jgi:hypothetical protein
MIHRPTTIRRVLDLLFDMPEPADAAQRGLLGVNRSAFVCRFPSPLLSPELVLRLTSRNGKNRTLWPSKDRIYLG